MEHGDPGAAGEEGPAAPSTQKLVLQALDMEGFKSYHGSVRVGAPFGPFTCIVGPNGAGKSVVGEAIAFALGGNAKMMRAKNLGSLVNHTLAGPKQAAAAQVTVHFAIYGNGNSNPQQPNGGYQGYLGVRRRVTRAGRSETATCFVAPGAWNTSAVGAEGSVGAAPDGVANSGEAANDGDSEDGGAWNVLSRSGRWEAVTPDDLQQQLAQFGIQTQAIDRIVVTQHRQAVNVQDGVKLAGFLELLIGTAGYQERVEQLQGCIEETWQRQEAAEEEAVRLDLRRQALAPEVAKWAKYEEERRSQALARARVLARQAALLGRQAAELEQRAAKAQAGLKEASGAQTSAKQEADRLLDEKGALSKELAAAESAFKKLTKQVEAGQMERAKLEVRLKAAKRTGKKGGGGSGASRAGATKKQLKAVQAEEAGLHEELARQQAVVRELEEDEKVVAQRVAQLAAKSGSSDLDAMQASLDALHQQLAAVEALLSSHALRQEQHQAAGAGAERELQRHAAAQHAAQAQRAEAEWAAAELRRGLAEGQGALEGKELELRKSREQQYASQAALDQLQRELQSIEGQLGQLQPAGSSSRAGPGQAHGGAGGDSRQSVNQAIAELAQANELPGVFYGRLCNVARVVQPQALQAVNAVLMESCNLSTTFVVSTRAVAQRVVDHFSRHRVGLATCKILDELREPPRDAALRDGLVPLRQLVDVDATQAPGSAPLLSLLLRNWYLAPNKQAAVEALTRDRKAGGRRRNVVTAQGELFKADGELVGARQPPRALLPCLLGCQVLPLSSTGASEAELEQERQQLQAQRAELAPRVQQQAQQLRALAQQGDGLACEVAALRERLRSDSTKLRAAERALQTELKVQEGKLQRRGEQLRRELAAAQAAETAAAADLLSATQQKEQLEGRQAELRGEYEAAAGRVRGGGELLRTKADLEALQGKLAKARAEAAATEDRLSALSRRRQQLEKSAQAAQAAAAEAEQLQQQLEAAGRAAEERVGEAQRKQETAAELRRRVSKTEKEWKAAVRSHEQATAAAQALRAQVREAQQAQRAKQAQLALVQADLAAAQQAAVQLAGLSEPAAETGRGSLKEGDGAVEGPACGGDEAREEGSSEGGRAGSGKRARLEAAQSSRKAQQQPAWGGGLAGHDTAHESEAGSSEGEGEQRIGARAGNARPRRRLQLVDSSSSDGSGSEASGLAAAVSTVTGPGRSRALRSSQAQRRQPAAAWPTRSSAWQQAVEDSSDSGSDFEAGPARGSRTAASTRTAASRRAASSAAAAAGSRKARRQRGQQGARARRGPAAPVCSDADSEDEGEGEAGEEAVEEELAELQRRVRSLEALRASLVEGAVEEDHQVAAALEARLAEVDALEQDVQRLAGEKDALESERYAKFHAALQQVNAKLGAVYQQLTGGQGDAFCSYLEDRLAAFTEGVTFHVRPASSRWRPFGILSGGQQALATLALCFALQAAFPSPFFFFDEIDCALDTINAGRVADYIRSQRDAQYLVVSHKPQVYEKASCLVGVYHCGAGSDAVTVHFEQRG